jgi:hypothetical protein
MAKTLCFDLDGTLCTNTFGDYECAEPIEWAIARVNALAREGNRIVILTARGFVTKRDWTEETRAQLNRWGVEYDELVFGKPSADVYVDDRAVHSDAWRTADGFDPPGFTTVLDARCRPVLAATALPAVVPAAVSCVVEHGRTFAGRPLRLREHVGRLQALASAAGMRPGLDPEELTQRARAILLDWGRAPGADVAYTLTLIDAPTLAELDATIDGPDGTVAVSRRPLREVAHALRSHVVDGGELRIRAQIHTRQEPTRGWPLRRVRAGTVTAALGGQLGFVHNGALRVEPTAGRPSVQFGWLRAAAGAVAAPFEVAAISERDLAEADELMIVGTPFCILPVATVDDAPVADGAVGPVTRRLLDAWSAEVGLDVEAQTAELLRPSTRPVVSVP